jgi:hypothetical protein
MQNYSPATNHPPHLTSQMNEILLLIGVVFVVLTPIPVKRKSRSRAADDLNRIAKLLTKMGIYLFVLSYILLRRVYNVGDQLILRSTMSTFSTILSLYFESILSTGLFRTMQVVTGLD